MQIVRQDRPGQSLPLHALRGARSKRGVTLMEVMAVVAIMGILSGIGVAGLRSAMANARIKDAAYNVTAFMERTANEARRLDSPLCVKRNANHNKLLVYGASCSATDLGNAIDSLVLETPVVLIEDAVNEADFTNLTNWSKITGSNKGAQFSPRVGLTAAPDSGYFAVQYGGRMGLRGAALKVSTKNKFLPMMKHEDGSWFGI